MKKGKHKYRSNVSIQKCCHTLRKRSVAYASLLYLASVSDRTKVCQLITISKLEWQCGHNASSLIWGVVGLIPDHENFDGHPALESLCIIFPKSMYVSCAHFRQIIQWVSNT